MSCKPSFVEKLKKIAEKAKVSEIIIVDDDFESNRELEKRSVALVQIRQLYNAGKYDELSFLEKYNIAIQDFDDLHEVEEAFLWKWDQLSKDEKQGIFDIFPSRSHEGSTDQLVTSLKNALSEASISVNTYDLQEWTTYFERLKTEVAIDKAPQILVFFDEDFSNAGTTAVKGRDLVQQVMNSDTARFIIPGILTQEVKNEAEEILFANQLFNDGIFVGVLGKYRKNDIEDFSKGIISYFLINYLRAVKDTVFDSYSNDESLKARLNGSIKQGILLDILRTARQEGAPIYKEFLHYAIDYHALEIENEIRRKCIENDKVLLLEELDSKEISGVSLIHDYDEESRKDVDETLAYIGAEDLAETHHPLEIGDLFCIKYNGKAEYYGLLNQPCSVALRSTGTRKLDSINLVRLAYGKPSENSIRAGSVSTGLPKFSRLDDNFYMSTKDSPYIYFEFTNTILISSNILDLCAFSKNGKAETETIYAEDAELLEYAMRQRRGHLKDWYDQVLRHYQDCENAIGDIENKESILHFILQGRCGFYSEKIEANVQERNLVFNIERVGRLKERYSHGILIEYARYLSRPAYPASLVEG